MQLPERKTLTELARPFAPEIETIFSSDDPKHSMLSGSEVIHRLNKVFGLHWQIVHSYTHRPEEFLGGHVMVNQTIVFNVDSGINERSISRDACGAAKIRLDENGAVINLNADIQTATFNAIKNAMLTTGIGLYLFRSKQSLENDAAENEIHEQQELEETWKTFLELFEDLGEREKQALTDYWIEISGMSEFPTLETVTIYEYNNLWSKMIDIIVNGPGN